MEQKQVIRIELSLNEVNQVLAALGEQPAKSVLDVLIKIRDEAVKQLSAQAETNKEKEDL